ncbi:MAG TPA: hypothetical protein VFY98_03805 [Intrasporangium sp.]|nr:hypothetical protein [Intrasporangium sp.]
MPPLLADPLIRVLGVVENGSRLEDLRDHGLHGVPTAPSPSRWWAGTASRRPLTSIE